MILSLRLEEAQRAALETNVHSTPGLDYSMSRYQAHIFGDRIQEQHRIASLLENKSYEAIGNPKLERFEPLLRVAEKLLDCCKTPSVYFDEAACQFNIHEYQCKSRLCRKCRINRSMILKESMKRLVKEFNMMKFITLTPRSNDESLKDQIKDLVASFHRLRRCELWKRKIKGGVYTIEVTYNRDRRQWHPHLHLIADGQYIEKQDLSDMWKESSNGSYIVDIKAVYSQSRAVWYITKYVNKTHDSDRYPDAQIPEWAISVKGLRFVSTFGNARGHKLTEEKEEDEREQRYLGHLCQLAKGARDGDQVADELWEAVVGEAQKGALPTNAHAKERAIDRRLGLVKQLTLWIDNFGMPPPEDLAGHEDPPTKKQQCPDTDPVLFSLRPGLGSQ